MESDGCGHPVTLSPCHQIGHPCLQCIGWKRRGSVGGRQWHWLDGRSNFGSAESTGFPEKNFRSASSSRFSFASGV